ncbi:phage tail protein [Providencia huaxiensis]|uniref:phage tail protein n=1 Tax=Providencia huaxiensis TaxID=2027290 RepID=UPI0032D9D184
MTPFYTILTNYGKTALAEALAAQQPLKIPYMAVGDGAGEYYDPTETQTNLRNEQWRGDLNDLRTDEELQGQVIAEAIIPHGIDGDWTAREIGLFDGKGGLVAVGKYPETYVPSALSGARSQIYINIVIKIDNVAAVELIVDHGQVLANKLFVQNFFDKLQVGDGSMIGLPVGTLRDAIDWVTPRMFGAESYFDLYDGQASSSKALQDAINYAYENGKTVTLGVGEKLFLDAPIRFKGKVFNLNGGILEVSPSYAGNVVELGSDDPALWGATDGYFGNFTIQTTKEDDRTATRAEKEGQYTGLYYDTTYRPVFNVQPSGIHINRPKIGIRWAGSNVDLNGWSTSLIHSGCSILGFEIAIQVDKTAGIVGENIFNDLMLYNQRTTPNAKVFKLEKGTSLILNNPIFWNDGAETFDMFDITSLSPMAMVSINGGYFESDASTFVHPQVAINGNLKVTTKSGGGDATKAVIFQPNITGAQVNNLISCEPDKWIVVSGGVSGISSYYQSRPMYALASNTTLRFDVGDEGCFKGLSNLTFSCWMNDTQYSKSYLGIQVTYSDGTQDNFSSAYVFGNGKNHLAGVSVAPKGLAKDKIPTRMFVTINTTSNTCKVGIPVLSTSSNMPLYNVPLDGALSVYKWNLLESGNPKPSVRNGYFHKTANTTATKYTDFTGAFANQKIFIKVADSNTSIDLSNLGNLRGNTPTGTIVASYKLNVGDVIKAEKDLDSRWYCTIIRGSDL